MTIEDFETAMNVMFWGTVYTTLAALPHMRPGARPDCEHHVRGSQG